MLSFRFLGPLINLCTIVLLISPVSVYPQSENRNATSCPHTGAACTDRLSQQSHNVLRNGNAALGMTYNHTACGLNYVQGSVLIEQRSTAFGFNVNGTGLPSSVSISGIPSCFIMEHAYLTFIASYTEMSPPAAGLSLTNPASTTSIYVPSVIGTDGEKCWSEVGTAVYRADVTASISGNGVYSFDITGFANASSEIDGATLLIIYRDPSVAYQGTLIYWDGAETSGGLNSYSVQSCNMTGFNACGNSTYANAFLMVSDMQEGINGGIHISTLNGTPSSFNNNFWNFNVANTSVTAGQSSANFIADTLSGDCYCMGAIGLYFQTTTCAVCTTTTSTLTLTPQSNAASCGNCNGSASVTVTGGSGSYNFIWNPSGQITQTATNLCPGNYTVTVSDVSGCNSSTIPVTVVATGGVVANISSSANVTCHGDCNGNATITPSGGTPPYTYLWLPTGGNGISASNLCAGIYTVTVTDDSNCTTIDTVTISEPAVLAVGVTQTNVSCHGGNNGTATASVSGGTTPYTYVWTPVGGQSATANSLFIGPYSVLITDSNQCSATGSVTITEPATLAVSIDAIPAICIGQNAILNSIPTGGTPPYSYFWNTTEVIQNINVSPVLTTPYNVHVTDSLGCTANAAVSVNVYPALSVAMATVPPACFGQTVHLRATVIGGNGGPYNYAWLPATGLSCINCPNPTVTPDSTTTYSVTVTDNCGTPAVFGASTAIINPLPNVLFGGDNLQGCAPHCVNFINLTANNSTCHWNFGGGTSSDCNPNFCFENPGIFTVSVQVTDSNGCSGSLALPNYITVYPRPIANFSMHPDHGTILAPAICFSDATTDATDWQWNFGDALDTTGSNLRSPCHSYADTGTYCIRLHVKNTSGCSDSIEYCLRIEQDFAIFVPNAFTPNNDGINDLFYPIGYGIDASGYDLLIFNRWGNTVFHTKNPETAWDGSAGGGKELVQTDIYLWKITCTDVFGKTHDLAGRVSLVK